MSNWDNITFNNSDTSTSLATCDDFDHFVIQGEDAQKFLQGQLTCDLNALAEKSGTFAAHCNPKGRMISSFLLFKLGENSFLLRVRKSLSDTALQALKKYMIFSKAELELAGQYLSFSISSTQLEEKIGALKSQNPNLLVHTINPEYAELCCPREELITLAETLTNFVLESQEQFTASQIQNGIAELIQSTSEHFLPQELSYDLIDAVSFKKGCYTGQEVVARLHFKGKLKKHLRLGSYSGQPLATNEKIYNSSKESACGVVAAAAQNAQKTNYVLALVDDDSFSSDECVISLESGSKIQWLELPYAIT